MPAPERPHPGPYGRIATESGQDVATGRSVAHRLVKLPGVSSPSGSAEEPEATPPSGSLGKTVFKGAGLAGGGYVLAQAINLGVYIALSRLLVPSDFGAYAAATVLVGFGVLIVESGMQAALIQREDRLEEAQSTALAASIAGGVAAALLGLATAPLLGLIFDSGEIAALAAASSGIVLISVLSIVPNAILQRQFSFLRLLVVDPIEVIFFGAVSIIAAVNDLGAWSLVIGQYAGMASGVVLSWALVRWRPRPRQASMAMWRELIAYGKHIFVSTSILRIGEQAVDTLIIGRGLGTGALGQYRYAFRVASMPYYVMLAGAAYVIFPALARIAGDRERLGAAFLRSLRWMAAIGFPAGLLLVPIGPPLVVIVFGDVWLAAGYATIGMCLYAGASSISSAVSELLKANGTPKPLTAMHSVTTAVTAAGMLALVPFGLSAAAAGLSIGAVAGAAYALRAASRACPVSARSMWAEIWPPWVAGVMMALAVLPLDRFVFEPASRGIAAGLGLIAVEALVGAVLYLGFLRILAPRMPGEIFRTLRDRGGSGEIGPDLEILETAPDGPREISP